jgi:hypothetical protein
MVQVRLPSAPRNESHDPRRYGRQCLCFNLVGAGRKFLRLQVKRPAVATTVNVFAVDPPLHVNRVRHR